MKKQVSSVGSKPSHFVARQFFRTTGSHRTFRSPIIVLNLFGGPCAGKSTVAAGVFYQLKMSGVNCELVTEVAKDFTWEERDMTLNCQPYVFAKQMKRLWRLKGKVDVVITDSPILMSVVYAGEDWPESFKTYVVDQFHEFNNLNVFLRRNKDYNPVGRGETREQAIGLDDKIMQIMLDNRITMSIIKGDHEAVDKILEMVTFALEKLSEKGVDNSAG